MGVSPLNSMLATVNSYQIRPEVQVKQKEPITQATNEINEKKNDNKTLKITAVLAGLVVLGTAGIYAYKSYKLRQFLKNIDSTLEIFQNNFKKINTEKPVVSLINTVEQVKNMPKMLPAAVNSYAPLTLSQRILQYKANVETFIGRECSPVSGRGTVQVLPIKKFLRWDDAAKRLNNVTKQVPSDTYKSFKICINTFKERYGLQDREVGFIKEAMNMFADRIKMALTAKENVDPRILVKQITPEQLFAEKISGAFVPSLETNNDVVLNKLFEKVSEAIHF